MKPILRTALFAAGLSFTFSVGAESLPAPESAATCVACHGAGGAKPILPEYPVLAGQYASYLEHALQEYRSGKRKNAIMAAQAANLSDADIRALARYFESQPGPLYTPRVR